MTDKVVILVTAANLRQARKIARRLVEEKLAACVNIISPIRSIYRWEGKVADDRELLLLIKSRRELFDEVRAEVMRNHTYSTPEVICLQITEGSADYLRWIEESVKQTTGA